MSLTKLMGMPLDEISSMGHESGFRMFEQKTSENNINIEKPAKYRIEIPLTIGVVLGASLAYFSKTGGPT